MVRFSIRSIYFGVRIKFKDANTPGVVQNPVKVAFPPEYLATSSDISKIQLCSRQFR